MKVWIDCSNSPHPLLFAPVAREIERRGHSVVVTARDNAQTVPLTHERWPEAEVIGGESPKQRRGKAAAIAGRVATLRRWARANRPQVALSHNSYAQIVAARTCGIRAVTAMDFEGQPANHLGFRLAHSVLLPEALDRATMSRQGATHSKTVYYAGLKEEIYLGDFEPSDVLEELGVQRQPGDVIVVARTPPSRAIYHNFDNPLFVDALRTACAQPHVRVIVLPRHREQRDALADIGGENLLIPERTVDSRSLMHSADLVLGAGGTMTREAALLGVPTFSLFAGQQPAVDRWLQQHGLLRVLERADQLRDLQPRPDNDRSLEQLRERGASLSRLFADVTAGPEPATAGATAALAGSHG